MGGREADRSPNVNPPPQPLVRIRRVGAEKVRLSRRIGAQAALGQADLPDVTKLDQPLEPQKTQGQILDRERGNT